MRRTIKHTKIKHVYTTNARGQAKDPSPRCCIGGGVAGAPSSGALHTCRLLPQHAGAPAHIVRVRGTHTRVAMMALMRSYRLDISLLLVFHLLEHGFCPVRSSVAASSAGVRTWRSRSVHRTRDKERRNRNGYTSARRCGSIPCA